MASTDNIEGLELKGIIILNRDELGRGAYERVYAVKYCQTICAAKELHQFYFARGSWAREHAKNHRIVHKGVSTMQYITSP